MSRSVALEEKEEDDGARGQVGGGGGSDGHPPRVREPPFVYVSPCV